MDNVCSLSRAARGCKLLMTKLLWNSAHEAAHGISLHRVGRPESRLMGVLRLWPHFRARGHSTMFPIQHDPLRSVHPFPKKPKASVTMLSKALLNSPRRRFVRRRIARDMGRMLVSCGHGHRRQTGLGGPRPLEESHKKQSTGFLAVDLWRSSPPVVPSQKKWISNHAKLQ